MATLLPFAGIRPDPAVAAEFICPPYDVPTDAEARDLVARQPKSFLRVTRPETVMGPDADAHSPAAYQTAREVYEALLAEGTLRRDAKACYYVYRLTWRGESQTGLVALASVSEYHGGVFKRHELTRPDKENDRVAHIEALRCQTGLVFSGFRATPAFSALLRAHSAGVPVVDVLAEDGVRHELWVVDSMDAEGEFAAAAHELDALYICDGHHRAAAASRVAAGESIAVGILTVAFPHDQLRILPYHRVVTDLNGHTPEAVRAAIHAATDAVTGVPGAYPAAPGTFSYYLGGGEWTHRRFKSADRTTGSAVDRLDAALLQRLVLEPVLGIDDIRKSPRIRFVGGIRGTGELERQVDAGEAAIAFAHHPTSMEELFAVADAGLLMPPKSTWFEPKLRDGVVMHAF
ncbi:MAG: DUF1015 family protein [Candidatus Sumerlaeia bacterium]|nr:DUF1015 family protein [Candidatus Sumerlaeia bacterium]